jgi:hypothetical protein
MRFWTLILASLLIGGGTCRGQESRLSAAETLKILEAYARIQKGEPPSRDPAAVSAAAGAAGQRLQYLKMEIGEWAHGAGEKCARFADLSVRLARELQSALALFARRPYFSESSTDGEFELANRIQIGIAIYSQLGFLLNSDAEAGYSVLDWNVRHACAAWPQRARLKAAYQDGLNELTGFFRLAFGSPGLEQMNAAQNRLIKLSIADEARDRVKFWTIMTVGTAASLVLWEFGPPVAVLAIRAIWGQAPKLMALPAVIFSVKASALVAEGVVFSYADQLAATSQPPPKTVLGTWEEHMDSIRFFIESPVHSPEMQLLFLSRVHALNFSDSLGLITGLAPLLRSEEGKWGSIENAISAYRRAAVEVTPR